MFEDEKEMIQISFTDKKIKFTVHFTRNSVCASINLIFNFIKRNGAYLWQGDITTIATGRLMTEKKHTI